MTAEPLDTTVAGSPGTCVQAADALDKYAGWIQQAGDLSRGARTVAESGWDGPAHDAFDRVIQTPLRTADDLAFTCQEAMRALTNFADALTRVMEAMFGTVEAARGGGLEVQGPLILPPSPAPPKPTIARQASSAGDAAALHRDYQAKMDAWLPLANEYNRKARLFNDCADKVRDARIKEDEAHGALRDALGPISEKNIDDVGFVISTELSLGTAAALNTVSATGGVRADAVAAQRAFLAEADLFQRWATGDITVLTPNERTVLSRAAAVGSPTANVHLSQVMANSYQQRIDRYDQWLGNMPDAVRNGVTAYPKFSALQHADAGLAARATNAALKNTPYVGTAVTIGFEAWNAYQDQQSWPKAAAKAGAGIAGTTVGGMLGGAMGSVFPGPGTVIGSAVGATVGSFAGSYVVDSVAPGEDPYAEDKVDLADTSVLDESKVVRPGAVPTPPPAPR
ncbi:hypothetical protein [Actinophytocola gossypii]|uniref:WXG100 family type VII secretion target n=1 Tax=Actinophytocola gossypii TaxID=2812003 RepID=A0ABT2JGS7_9PSEU|nr:hypothetical protein [Actinophytocola gossypii]MCT2587068.1 hypothetical protein [Actinophytocola gossypii]